MPRKASAGHIRGLEIDYRNASDEDRPSFLRHIVYKRWGQSTTWKGRFNVLDEIANGAYELAPDKTALEVVLDTIGKDIQAYIDGAALRNKDTKPGVVAARLASAVNRVRLDKTEAKTRLGVDMPAKQTPLETPGKMTGGLFGNKTTVVNHDMTDFVDALEAGDPEKAAASLTQPILWYIKPLTGEIYSASDPVSVDDLGGYQKIGRAHV